MGQKSKTSKAYCIALGHLPALIITIVTNVVCKGFILAYTALIILVMVDIALLARRCVGASLKNVRWNNRVLAIITIGSFLLGGLLIWTFLAKDHELKQYDSTVYWIKVINNYNNLKKPPIEFLKYVRDSLHGEYSDIAALPLIPICWIMDLSFRGLCMSVYAMYYFPMCILAALYVARMFTCICPQKAQTAFVVTVVSAILMTPLIYPLLCGYVDVVGVMLALMLMHLALNEKLWNTGWIDFACYVLLSVLLVFTRRWYSFLVVAFYVSVGVQWLIEQAENGKIDWNSLSRLIARLLEIAGTCAALIFMVSPESFKMFFRSDYAIAYSAYKERTWSIDLMMIIQAIGGWCVIIAIFGLIYMMINIRTRNEGTRLLIIVSVAFALFERIQSMGTHHRYMVVMFVLLWYSVGVTLLVTNGHLRYRVVLSILSVGMLSVNYAQSFLIEDCKSKSYLFSSIHYLPRKEELFSIARKVKTDLSEITGEKKTFYVCGNTEYLSSEVLSRINLPEEIDAAPNMVDNNIIDLRDGFPSQMFFADYILTVQSHSIQNQEKQWVIQAPIQLLETNKAFLNTYEVIRDYCDSNLLVKLYEKKKAVSVELVSILNKRIQEKYPDYRDSFAPDYYVALMQIDGEKGISYDPWEILVDKEKGKTVTLEWNLQQKFSSMQCKFANWIPGMMMNVYYDDEHIQCIEMPDYGSQQYEFDVQNIGVLRIELGTQYDQTEGLIHLLGGSLIENYK